MMAKNRSRFFSALFVSLLIFRLSSARADILDNWHWRNPSPFPDTMHSVCFGGGLFVAAGDGGVVHTSSDGTNWDSGHRPVLFTLNKVIYANGEFVAVGNSGAIVTSTDGVDWTVQSSGAANDLYAVAYGNGRFVVCGLNGQQVISTDGTNWTPATNSSVGPWWITFGNGVFVAAGPGTNVEVSADGQSWASFGLPFIGYSWPHAVFQAEYGNGMFIAVAGGETSSNPLYSQPTPYFYASTDGTNWTQKSSFNWGPTANGPSDAHRFLVFLNGAFHEVDDWVDAYGFVSIEVTTDGTSYTTKYAPTNAHPAQSMAYGNGKYVIIEQSGSSWASADETNWVGGYKSGFQNQVVQIIGGQRNLVAFASSLPVLVSSNGVTFSVVSNSPAGILGAAIFDGTNYVALGGADVYTSTNATNWVKRNSNSGVGLSAVCRGPSGWVAVGGGGTITTSPNTLTWTLRSSGTGNALNGVAFGNGVYVAVGNVGTVITSTDGTTGDAQFSGTTDDLGTVRFLNGQFIVIGPGGIILTSSDGVNWSSQNSGTTASLFAVDYGNGRYLVCGYGDVSNPTGSIFLTSTNGTNWQNVTTKIPATATARSVAYLNQSFWIVGDSGMILQSDVYDGIPHVAGSVMPGNGGMKLNVSFNPPVGYRVQFRANLFTDSWHDVYTNTSPTGSDTWTDTNAAQRPSGFYRIVSP
jgi:hypothetical protein